MSICVISPEEANKRWVKLYSSVKDEFSDQEIFNSFRGFIAPPPRLNCFSRIAENFIQISEFLTTIISKSDFVPSYSDKLDVWGSLCKIFLGKTLEIEHVIPGFTAPEEADSPPPYHGYYGSHCLGAALWFSPTNASKTLKSNYRILQAILFIAVNEAKILAVEEKFDLDSQMSKACLAVRKLSARDYYNILNSLPAESCSISEYEEYIDEQIEVECSEKKIIESKSTLYPLRHLIEIVFGKTKVITRTKSAEKRENTSNEIISDLYLLGEDDDGKSGIPFLISRDVTGTEKIRAERLEALLTDDEFTAPREVISYEKEGKDPSGGLSLGQQYLKAKEAVKSITMDNQRLPFAMGFLSPHDIDLFLQQLRILSATAGSILGIANEELAAFLAINFWTSRPVDDVVKSTLAPYPEEPQSNVAIYRQDKNEWFFLLKAKAPELKTEASYVSEEKALPRAINFYLPVPVQAENAIYPWLKNFPEMPVAVRIFSHNTEEYEAASDEFFTSLRRKYGSRLNSSKVHNHLHLLISRLPSSDTTMAMAISGNDDNIGKVHFHYTANSTTAARDTYQKAVDDICGSQGNSVNGADPDQPEQKELFVGSNFVPTRQEIARIVKAMREKLAELRRELVVSPEKLIAFHNEYTSYTVLLTGFCTGYRAVHDPLFLKSEIDRTSGFAVISDKDGNDFYHTRIVWLPPICLTQLERYSEHMEQMSRELFLRNQQLFFSSRREEIIGRRSEREYPGLFYLDDIKSHAEVRPGNLEEYLKQIDFTLPVNSNRHYLRTNLLKRKCSLEVVNAFMGHWEMGLEPWGMYSGLQPDTYKRELEKHLVDLVNEDSWDEEIGFRNTKIA